MCSDHLATSPHPNPTTHTHPNYQQLHKMDRALRRPTHMLDALRLAHRLRPGGGAPLHWQPGLAGLDFLPPTPYMPVNECIAASLLRRHHLGVQRANRGAWVLRVGERDGLFVCVSVCGMCMVVRCCCLYGSLTDDTTPRHTNIDDKKQSGGSVGEHSRAKGASRSRGRR